MDIASLVEFMEGVLPGTVVEALVTRDAEGMTIVFKIEKVNGQEVAET